MDSEDLDHSLLEQHREQLSDQKHELFVVHEDLISLDLDDDNPLVTQHASLVRLQFNCFHVKKLISTRNSSNEEGKGVKLPKIDVPTFNGDVLNWTRFWGQFKVLVHERTIYLMLRNWYIFSKLSKEGQPRMLQKDCQGQVTIIMKPLTTFDLVITNRVYYIELMYR